MSIQDKICDIALREVGVREIPGANNTGPRIVTYQRATWLDPAPWPWCAAFTAWALHEALRTPDGASYLSQRKQSGDAGPDSFRCKDAAAFGWIKWAGKHGLQVFDEHSDTLPEAGDFVVFDFSHIGVVTGYDPIGNTIRTVEGNTNGRGERDSESGDGVWQKVRAVNLVRSYIRL